jgi:hypothetical protein
MTGWEVLEHNIQNGFYWANHWLSLTIGRELGLW